MRKAATIGAVLALLATASVALAAGGKEKARDDFGKLVQANLGEAATLKAELPSLKTTRAKEVWREMIKQHLDGARMVEREDRKVGGHPDTRMPAAQPAAGGQREIVVATLEAHRQTLAAVKGMEMGASMQERVVLRKVEGVVQHHIEMLEGLHR